MSREIKFRAWKMHNGKMSRCIYTPVSIMHYVQTHLDEPVMKHSGENNIRNFMPDADIIEQYIGLEDRNGKEIYEGDIVKWENSVAVVIWREGHAEFGIRWVDCKIEDEFDYWNVFRGTPKVIGNIHENPELLGGEE